MVAARIGAAGNSYQVLRKLAVGGMAEIFLVRSETVTGVERYCVLKRILPHESSNAHFVEMFLNEARLATQLQHPNIASVYDIGMVEDSYFYTMEYVHGETVRELSHRANALNRPLPLACVLTIIAGAAAGLHHAHERKANDGRPLGIVHRDVSPSNLMVSYEGNVKLVDFGIAKASDGTIETRSGLVKGKISYLSPEQCHGERLDRRSDLFSLGIVAWEMLTGQRLYRRTTEYESMAAIAHEVPPRPSTLRPEIPPAIEDIVLRLLARSVAARFQTAAEVIETLENASIRAGTMLSTAAVSRLMHDLFGAPAEPWRDLERARCSEDAVSLVTRPIAAELVDGSLAAGDPLLADELEARVSHTSVTRDVVVLSPDMLAAPAPAAPREVQRPTASIEVSASFACFAPATPGTQQVDSSRSLRFEAELEAPDAVNELARPTRPARPPAIVPAEPEPSEDAVLGTVRWQPPAAASDARLPTFPTLAPRMVASHRSSTAARATARRARSSRVAVLLAASTLVAAATLGVIAQFHGAKLDTNRASEVAPVDHVREPQVAAASLVGASGAATLEPARPDSSATAPAPALVPVATAPAPSPAATAPPALAIEAPAAAEPPSPSAQAASTTAVAPPPLRAVTDTRTAHRPPTSTRPAGAAPRASSAKPPTPSPGTKPPSRSIRELFEHEDYGSAVLACRETTMTAQIADTCTRAACRVHDTVDAQLWLRSSSGELRERLAAFCAQLGTGELPTRSLDCAKDPLDCR